MNGERGEPPLPDIDESASRLPAGSAAAAIAAVGGAPPPLAISFRAASPQEEHDVARDVRHHKRDTRHGRGSIDAEAFVDKLADLANSTVASRLGSRRHSRVRVSQLQAAAGAAAASPDVAVAAANSAAAAAATAAGCGRGGLAAMADVANTLVGASEALFRLSGPRGQRAGLSPARRASSQFATMLGSRRRTAASTVASRLKRLRAICATEPAQRKPASIDMLAAILSEQELASAIPTTKVRELARHVRSLDVAAGGTVFEQGAPGDLFYLVRPLDVY